MCCDDQCFFFIPVRIGSLIFGYINAILSGLGTLICMGVSMYFNITLISHQYPYLEDILISDHLVKGFLAEFLTGFVCSALMLIGIKKDKPTLVKGYIIFGLVQEIMWIIFIIILHLEAVPPVFAILEVTAGGIYGSILYMIYLQYKTMITTPPFNPQVNDTTGIATC